MPPSDHRAKRPYNGSQPSITSFFSRASNPKQEENVPTFPAQPGQIQADLLTVGMRVRKAVPEGYKTGTYSALSIFHDNTAPPAAIPSEPDVIKQSNNTAGSRQVFHSNVRELAPFCGLNKVGGLGQQFMAPNENYIPLSSQESNISLESVGAGKRRFDDDDDDEDEQTSTFSQGSFGSWLRGEEEISPKSKPLGLGVGIQTSGRAMAVPKTRRKRVDESGQENAMDFEDADFLDYGHLSEPAVGMNDV